MTVISKERLGMNNKEIMSRVMGGIHPYVRVINIDGLGISKSSPYIQLNMMCRLVDAEIDGDSVRFVIDYSDCSNYNKTICDIVPQKQDVVHVNMKDCNFEIVNLSHVPNFKHLKQVQSTLHHELKRLGHSDAKNLSFLLSSAMAKLI